jgi:hypothetical protein
MGNREKQVIAATRLLGDILRQALSYGYSEDVLREAMTKVDFSIPHPPTPAELQEIYAQARLMSMEPEGSA